MSFRGRGGGGRRAPPSSAAPPAALRHRAAAAQGQRAEAKLLPPLLPRPLGGATAGEGLGSHAGSQSQLRVAGMSGATSLRTHSAVRRQGARIPGGRPPHRARSATRGSKAAFLPAAAAAAALTPHRSCWEIYTSRRLFTGTPDAAAPRAVTDVLKFHKLSQRQAEYSAY